MIPLRLVGPDGRATAAARCALALAVLIAFGLGFALRPGTEEAAVSASAEPQARATHIAAAEPAGAVPRLSGAAALPQLDRTPRRRRAAGAAPAQAAPATSTTEPAAAVDTPAPAPVAAPPASPPPAARPAPARPSPTQSPAGQTFDSSG